MGGRVKSGPRDCKAEISGGWSNDLFNGRNRVGRVIGRGTDSELYIKNWVFPCISSAKQGVVKKTEWMHERILEWEAVSWYQMPGSSSNPTFPEAFMFSSGFENEREERPLRWRKRMSKGTAKAMRFWTVPSYRVATNTWLFKTKLNVKHSPLDMLTAFQVPSSHR